MAERNTHTFLRGANTHFSRRGWDWAGTLTHFSRRAGTHSGAVAKMNCPDVLWFHCTWGSALRHLKLKKGQEIWENPRK